MFSVWLKRDFLDVLREHRSCLRGVGIVDAGLEHGPPVLPCLFAALTDLIINRKGVLLVGGISSVDGTAKYWAHRNLLVESESSEADCGTLFCHVLSDSLA